MEQLKEFAQLYPLATVFLGLLAVGFIFGVFCSARLMWQDHIDDKRRQQNLPPLYHMW